MENLPGDLLSGFESLPLKEVRKIELMHRVDKKYLTDSGSVFRLLEMMQGEYLIQECDGERIFKYITLYFDTADRELFMQHHNEHLIREKIRIRSYSKTGNSFFEIKKRDNRGFTDKRRIKAENVDFNSDVIQFLGKNSYLNSKEISGCFQTKFERITLVNRARSERVTIDFNLEFENKTNGNLFNLQNLAIIEIKQESWKESAIRDYLREMRIKETGFSKYCIGSILTDNTLKRNLFKRKLMQIDKITNYKNGIVY